MQTSALVAATPYYVLIHAKNYFGPAVVSADPAVAVTAIYGFSDKPPYDKFCSTCEVALTPYPLVKGYLQTRLVSSPESLCLVVLDAGGPSDLVLHAATSAQVLEAQQSGAAEVTATYQLVFDPQANVYRLQNAAA